MLSAGLWNSIWILYIAEVGLLGVGMAMIAGITLAAAEYQSALIAVLLAALCGYLCVLAEESRERIRTWR